MELKILLWVYIVGELPSSAPPCGPFYVRTCIHVYVAHRRHAQHAESASPCLATIPVVIDMACMRSETPSPAPVRLTSRVLPLRDVFLAG